MNLKILDPATGSGKFLVAAYKEMLNWYKRYYVKNKCEDKLYWNKHSEPVLTIIEKKDILLKHIYGVDIDPQAVEVTKLFLLLIVLEGECEYSFRDQLPKNKQALPELSNNIKHGNSIISSNFYDSLGDSVFMKEEKNIVAFDWGKEFSDIMDNGGFNIIIGNPPYGAWLTCEEKEYMQKVYSIGMTDTAALFIFKSHEILAESGTCSMIVPKALLYSSKWKSIRDLIFSDIEEVTDVGKVWSNVKLEQSIFQFTKSCASKSELTLH